MIQRILRGLSRRLRRVQFEGYPACPTAHNGYVLVTSNMVHFDLLDGDEDCGGVEMKGDIGDNEQWMVHVYGVDVVFPSLSKARAWLGKTRVEVEPA